MRKVIAAINMTVDGYCDHTAIDPDEEIHRYYTDLVNSAGVMLYGRITYQLMEYWRPFIKAPSGNKAMDDFALAMNKVPKIVFSHTLKDTGWDSAQLASRPLAEEVAALKQQPGKDIFVGSPGLIAALTQLHLVDEYQLCVHPVIVGQGLPLFRNISERTVLKLLTTRTFGSGAIILYYEPAKNEENVHLA